MPSSSRIIPAEEVDNVAPFSLGALHAEERPRTARRLSDPDARDDALLRESFELGYRRGFAEARARAAQERDDDERAAGATLAQRVASIEAGLHDELQKFEEHAAQRLVDLAVEIARRMVGATFDADRRAVVPVAQEAIDALLGQPAPATLRVAPVDADAIAEQLAPVLARRNIELVADATITPGGCLLTSATAEVDARVEERWRRVLASIGRDAAATGGASR